VPHHLRAKDKPLFAAEVQLELVLFGPEGTIFVHPLDRYLQEKGRRK